MTESAIVRVEVPGRLVRPNDRRPPDEGSGDGHPLLLTAGHLVRLVRRAVSEPDAVEHLIGAPTGLLRRGAAEQQRQLDVLDCVEHGDQVERLEDEPHRLRAVQGALGVAHREEVAPVDQDVTTVDVVQTREAVEHRGLAGP